MTEDLFTTDDLRQMAALGIAPEEAARQVALFRQPPPYTRLLRPCLVGDGIRQLFPSDHPELLDAFAKAAEAGRVGKFVPASGAATRMFQALLAFLNDDDKEMTGDVRTFFDNLPRFAFSGDLLRALLLEPGLGYAEKP